MGKNYKLFRTDVSYSQENTKNSKQLIEGRTLYYISALNKRSAEKMALKRFQKDYLPKERWTRIEARKIKLSKFISLKDKGVLNFIHH